MSAVCLSVRAFSRQRPRERELWAQRENGKEGKRKDAGESLSELRRRREVARGGGRGETGFR